jgi:hypothetical protein
MMSFERNDPCPCGSGLKYKKCCLIEAQKLAAICSAQQSEIVSSRVDPLPNQEFDDITALITRDKVQEALKLSNAALDSYPESATANYSKGICLAKLKGCGSFRTTIIQLKSTG